MEENKKTFKMPLIIVVAMLILLLVGGIVYITNSSKPKNIYLGAINSFLDSAESDQGNIKTANATLGLGININSQNSQIAKVAEYINKAKITMNAQLDVEQEKEIVKLGVVYDNENVIDAKLSYKNQENNIYAKVEELFDKTFAIEIDEETKKQFNMIFEEAKNLKLEENAASRKVEKIFKETISDNLKDEYFTQEEIELEIGEEKVKTKKSVLTLTDVQLQEVLSGIVKELKNNEEFMECYREEDKSKVLEILKELETTANEINSEITDTTFVFNVYTKGISNKFVKFELVLKDQKTENVISLTKNDAENYEFLVTNKYLSSAIGNTEAQEVLSGMIMVKDVNDTTKDFVIVLNIDGIGEVTVNLQVSYVINQPIENLDTSNSVNIESLTEIDQQKIMTNLQNMKIYTLVQNIIAEFSSSMNSLYSY